MSQVHGLLNSLHRFPCCSRTCQTPCESQRWGGGRARKATFLPGNLSAFVCGNSVPPYGLVRAGVGLAPVSRNDPALSPLYHHCGCPEHTDAQAHAHVSVYVHTHIHVCTCTHRYMNSQCAILAAIVLANVTLCRRFCRVLRRPQNLPAKEAIFVCDVHIQVHYFHQSRSQINQRNIPGEGLCK